MRLFGASAILLLVCAAASVGHAEGMGVIQLAGDSTLPRATRVPVCKCPGPIYHSGARRHRRSLATVRRYRAGPYKAIAVAPDTYNPRLPSPFDTAYDRAMTLHFRSLAVTGTYRAERGWPPTPPIHGLYPYRVRAWGTVYQYDGMIGQYVALALPDAARVAPVAVQLAP
jgi:hypothetical protein